MSYLKTVAVALLDLYLGGFNITPAARCRGREINVNQKPLLRSTITETIAINSTIYMDGHICYNKAVLLHICQKKKNFQKYMADYD